MWVLEGSGEEPHRRKRVVLAVKREVLVLTPRSEQDIERFLLALSGLEVALDSDPLRLVERRTTGETDLQPPVCQVVGDRDLLAKDQRVMIGRQDDAGADPDPPRATGGVDTMQQGRRTQVALDEVMLGEPDVTEARCIRVLHPLRRMTIDLRGGNAARSVERDEQAEFRWRSPSRLDLPTAPGLPRMRWRGPRHAR